MDTRGDVHAYCTLLGERCTPAKRARKALQGPGVVGVQLGRTRDISGEPRGVEYRAQPMQYPYSAKQCLTVPNSAIILLVS